jgi:hypothetical protein
MDRKEFLRGCASGLCACTVGCLSAPASAAEAPKADDWRVPFVKNRYAKLWQVLSSKLPEAEQADTLHQLGAFCASTFDAKLDEYRGNVDGFGALMKSYGAGDTFYWDKTRQLIAATSEERTDCICPLISKTYKTPAVVCNCSVGWHSYAWSRLMQKPVQVEVKETVLRGGKHCTFEIRVEKA